MKMEYTYELGVKPDGAARRDLSCIIGHMKGVNNASGPIDLYELGDFIAPSRGGEGVKNFFLHRLEFIRRLVTVQTVSPAIFSRSYVAS